MQQVIDTRKYLPMYVDKLTLYFTPRGSIIVRIGNQYVIASPDEVSELVQGRLTQHALIAELFNRGSGETHE